MHQAGDGSRNTMPLTEVGSPAMTVVPGHSCFTELDVATNFATPLMKSANGLYSAVGQYAAQSL